MGTGTVGPAVHAGTWCCLSTAFTTTSRNTTIATTIATTTTIVASWLVVEASGKWGRGGGTRSGGCHDGDKLLNLLLERGEVGVVGGSSSNKSRCWGGSRDNCKVRWWSRVEHGCHVVEETLGNQVGDHVDVIGLMGLMV